jgi:hypothetical protein
MTPQEIITEARYVLSDTNSTGTGYRQSNDEMLIYVNGAVRECAAVRTELFSTIGDLTCVPNQCEQGVTFSDAVALLEVLCIHGGAGLTVFNLDTMNAFNPGWRADASGPARQWTKFVNDPLKFYIYPKAPLTVQVLDVRYVRIPSTLAIDDEISELPAVLKTALVDYVVFRASSKDDEHIGDGRAAAFYQAFLAKLKG